eukprot:TRINITY_DN635_c0_g1_i2.p1 TRINITY_DN635_c0_g1~~TRINITY_DN635_c0_g1_i2.p1  ORF type:complete len:165 (-),score=18.05 TRINITY_DN635_c0_g1_i2:275-700(-)
MKRLSLRMCPRNHIVNKNEFIHITKRETMSMWFIFVPINLKYGNTSPTLSDSRTLLDHLNEIELDIETPSDEESLLYVAEDDLKDDSDIDEAYDWNSQKKPNKTRQKHRKHTNQDDEEEEEEDDDISMLSAQNHYQSMVRI